MKAFTLILLLLLSVNFTFKERAHSKVDNLQSEFDYSQTSNTKLNKYTSAVTPFTLNITKFKEYLEKYKDFQDLLITFGVSRSNEIYFIAIAANKPPQGSTLSVNDRASEEFSSEKRNGTITAVGSNREEQQNFIEGIGGALTIKGYYLNMNDIRSQIQKYADRTIDVEIVSKSIDNQSFMDLVFPPVAGTADNMRISTFDSGNLRSAPISGCPPFNCDF